jgi:hypothetical protein
MPNYLWWKPKDGDARGLVYDDGTIYAWPEDEMTHCDRIVAVGIGWCCEEFYIRVERGRPTLHQYLLSDSNAELVLEAMPSIDPPRAWQRTQGMLRTSPMKEGAVR